MKKLLQIFIAVIPLIVSFSTSDPSLAIRFLGLSCLVSGVLFYYLLAYPIKILIYVFMNTNKEVIMKDEKVIFKGVIDKALGLLRYPYHGVKNEILFSDTSILRGYQTQDNKCPENDRFHISQFLLQKDLRPCYTKPFSETFYSEEIDLIKELCNIDLSEDLSVYRIQDSMHLDDHPGFDPYKYTEEELKQRWEDQLFWVKEDEANKLLNELLKSAEGLKRQCYEHIKKHEKNLSDYEIIWSDHNFINRVRYSLEKHDLPSLLMENANYALEFNEKSKIFNLDFDLPKDFINHKFVIEYSKDVFNLKPHKYASERQSKEILHNTIFSLLIRAGIILSQDEIYGIRVDKVENIFINLHHDGFDPATGQEERKIVASVNGEKEFFKKINIDHVDPLACFKKLEGVLNV